MKTAVSLARENYKQHVKEADSGLVSQLDVLRVQDDFIQIERTYNQEVFNAKLAWIQIKSLAGLTP